MNFNQLKPILLEKQLNTIEIYELLKDALGAKSLDMLFLDEKEEVFFDKVTNIKIPIKFLDTKSIIGRSYLDKKNNFIKDIQSVLHYNLALDNPFKLDFTKQIILTMVKENKVIGFLRFSQIPLCFSMSDFKNLEIMKDTFIKIFLGEHSLAHLEEESKHIQISSQERLELYTNVNHIKTILNKLIENTNDLEVEKIIIQGKTILENIFFYINPSLNHTLKIKEARNKIESIDTSKISILLADDVKINLKILNALLVKNSTVSNIKLANDGEEVNQILQLSIKDKEHIHIIFLDHHMPGELGSQIAQKIRQKDHLYQHIIIVSITNDLSILDLYPHLYDYHIPKPFSKISVDNVMTKIKKHTKLSLHKEYLVANNI